MFRSLTSLLALALTVGALAQARFAEVAGAALNEPAIDYYDFTESLSNDGSAVDFTFQKTFTGTNASWTETTMTMDGWGFAESYYGTLRTYSRIQVRDAYYNEDNPKYWDGTTLNESGSPQRLLTTAYAQFTDPISVSGAGSDLLLSFVFHVDGWMSEENSSAYLGFTYAEQATENYFPTAMFGTGGRVSQDFATRKYNYSPGASIRVGLAAYAGGEMFDTALIEGESNFRSTVTLTGVLAYDLDGNLLSGYTVTGGSGTSYPVPEPASMAVLGLGLAALRRRRRDGRS